MRLSAIQAILPVIALMRGASASCECGYQTNTKDVWQYSITTAFDKITTAQFQQSSDWIIANLTYTATPARPYATVYFPNNVAIVDKALRLTCSSNNSAITNGIGSAQIQTQRRDVLYGSFRAQYSLTGPPGAIGALFFYANDTEEVDIELLTRDNSRNVHFTNQPSGTTELYMPNSLTRSAVNQYRLDWKPSATKFYINNILSSTITSDIPSVNGSVYLNAWADGGSFSGSTIPTSDVVMSVVGVQLYYNTSNATASALWQQSCSRSRANLCQVDSSALTMNTTASSKSNKLHARH